MAFLSGNARGRNTDRFTAPNGDTFLVVTVIVTDPHTVEPYHQRVSEDSDGSVILMPCRVGSPLEDEDAIPRGVF